MQNVVKLTRFGTPLHARARAAEAAAPWALRRTTALCLGNSGVEIACLRSTVLQTRHITVAGPRTVALQRAAPRRLRVEQPAWRSLQPPLAARRATALDDGRTYPTGRPRQPQRTLAHCVPAVCPHWHWTGQKANRSRAVSISQPGGQRPQLRGLPRSGKAHVMLLIAKSNSNVELSANDNHIGLKKWQWPP